MSVFGTIPALSPLYDIVGWILEGGGADEFAFAIEGVLPAATDHILEGRPALRIAWTGRDCAARVAAHIQCAQLQGWHEAEQDEQDNELAALQDWARKHAVMIRRCLLEPATSPQIAEALGILADVLDQSVSERTAAFMIELVEKARLPVYPLNALFEHVAKIEPGKIKPASFRMLQPMQNRTRTACLKSDARMFVDHLEAGLAYYREHLAGEKSAVGFE